METEPSEPTTNIDPATTPIVTVLWIDSTFSEHCGWLPPSELLLFAEKPLPRIHTTGYLIHQGEDVLTIAMSIQGCHATDLMRIPWHAIEEWWHIIPQDESEE